MLIMRTLVSLMTLGTSVALMALSQRLSSSGVHDL